MFLGSNVHNTMLGYFFCNQNVIGLVLGMNGIKIVL
jgi:hypothetical protein